MPARSFRLVSFCFEGFCLETDSCKVFHCQSEPKDAELRPRLAQEKDRVLRALFFTAIQKGPALRPVPGMVALVPAKADVKIFAGPRNLGCFWPSNSLKFPRIHFSGKAPETT